MKYDTNRPGPYDDGDEEEKEQVVSHLGPHDSDPPDSQSAC
jgi:hypothetical protein